MVGSIINTQGFIILSEYAFEMVRWEFIHLFLQSDPGLEY